MFTALSVTSTPSATQAVTETFAQRVSTGLGNLVLGMLVVFAVLTVLWLILEIVGKIFAKHDAKAAAKKASEAPAPADVAPVVEEEENDEELVAAITAAVALCLEAENGGQAPAFKVVSFRKTHSKQSWNN